MTELLFLILFAFIFALWIRACLIGHKLFQKIHGEESNFAKQVENQLGYFDQCLGMIFGNPENYTLYRPELLPYINNTKAAFKHALLGIAAFVVYLVFDNAL